MDISVLAAFVIGVLAVCIVGKMFVMPVRLLWKLVYNGMIGGVMLWLVNLVGASFGFGIGINIVSALVAGFLGIPGVALLVGWKLLG